jgi:hypothetical protein
MIRIRRCCSRPVSTRPAVATSSAALVRRRPFFDHLDSLLPCRHAVLAGDDRLEHRRDLAHFCRRHMAKDVAISMHDAALPGGLREGPACFRIAHSGVRGIRSLTSPAFVCSLALVMTTNSRAPTSIKSTACADNSAGCAIVLPTAAKLSATIADSQRNLLLPINGKLLRKRLRASGQTRQDHPNHWPAQDADRVRVGVGPCREARRPRDDRVKRGCNSLFAVFSV